MSPMPRPAVSAAQPGSAAHRLRTLTEWATPAHVSPETGADLTAVLDVLDVLADVTDHAVSGGRFVDPHVLRDMLAEVLTPAPDGLAERQAERRAQYAALRAELGVPDEPAVITAVHELVDAAHLREAAEQTMTLGALIDALAAAPHDAAVVYAGAGLDGQRPRTVDSWRGVYADLALDHDDPQGTGVTTVRLLLGRLRAADGSTFTGYKGGDFTMDRRTPVWVDNWGEWSGERGIRAVELARRADGDVVMISVQDHG